VEVGIGCGVTVGITGVFPSTISGTVGVGAFGGIKGVGVRVGAQAGNRNKASRMENR